ncbi:sensor domain-containing protein [Mycobacterium ahvazicum]|uniref:Sensor domain-containing protein n=1 Tax=Mycobacterium ahvazicum TaxID=1964395 RepID=A0A2K4YE42_9MYCO|nr:sensor domain-containing protein [Mycobacterium ahvazicum]SOX55056.1 sensor domain-containing protein [Mycobacterium ahvazicum]
MRLFRLTASLVIVAAVAGGCSAVVDGVARPAPNLKPRPLTGQAVKQALLDGPALSRMLDQPLVAHDPADVGGPGKLYRVDRHVSPADCLGVTEMLQASVYDSASQPAQVTDVTSESWWNNGEPAQVITVIEGVVALGSVAQAQGLFRHFSQQWQQCGGVTASERNGPIATTNQIGTVSVTDSIVAVTNTATSVLPNMPALRPTPQARAIGVRSNCLVEVQVVFFGERRSSDPGSGNIDTSGVDIAHAIMDKVSALS